MENPIKMDDLGVPSFGETSIDNVSFVVRAYTSVYMHNMIICIYMYI